MSHHTGKSSNRKLVLAIMLGIAVLVLGSQGAAAETWSAPGSFGPLRWLRPGQEAAAPSASAAKLWTSYPLYGGEMTAIAAHPTNAQIVYVGTRDAGVFKTTDGGQTWQPAREGLTFYPIRCLLINPRHPETLYAGTDNDGVWKSTNGGQSWANAGNGLNLTLIVFSLAMDPQDSRTLYAAMAGGVGLDVGHIYKTQDAGANWALADTGIPLHAGSYINGVFSLALDPANPRTVYAGTNYRGVFRSLDGGATWAALSQGLPFRYGTTDNYAAVNALALDPHHGNRLCGIIGGKYHIYASGQWQLINQGNLDANSGLFTDYLYFHPTNPNILYSAGDCFTISTDGGVNWTRKLGWRRSGRVPGIAFHPTTPDTIYAATDVLGDYVGGVYRSVDRGETWTETWQGITATSIESVASDPRNPARLYAGSGDGFLYRTQDGGATWGRGYYTRNPGPYEEKIYDFGAISDVAVDPAAPQKVYIAAGDFYSSTNYGEVFQRVAAVEWPNCIAMAPQGSGPIYVGASFGRGIYVSQDGGRTWEQKNQGLPTFGSSLNPILSLAIDPSAPSTVWAGTQYGGGILKSTDGGEHWQGKGLTAENFVEAIAVDPRDSDVVLVGAGFSDGSIFKSTDGGESWQEKVAGIAFVKKIVYDPRNPNWAYAATEGFGVLRSLDGGESWHDYSAGIFYPLTYSLAITADATPKLLAGSYGAGLYWTRLPSLAVVHLPALLK
ncbi:MAG: hypothetical protein GXY76_18110 [Chloroflexi bacterium]|nr:hypothetical protein [Chloroflexota bacterium]